MSKLTIIILNYNTKDLTIRAIQSCSDLKFKDLSIVVVDNASDDSSVDAFETMAKKESRLTVKALSENRGFAAGNNVALREVESEYVMLLNSDAYFPEDADLETALDFLDEYQDIGVLSPYVKLGIGRVDPACHRGFPTPWRAITYFVGLEKATKRIPILNRIFGGYHETWKNLNEIHDIDACTGAAMIVRRNAIEEVGLLDEQFFMYGEDLDWCYRFKEDEWRVLFFPGLTVIHDKHSSGLKRGTGGKGQEASDNAKGNAKIHTQTKTAFYEAMKLFYQKHDLGPSWMENLVLVGIHLLSRIR